MGNRKKVLVVGPSPNRSKGGMATVIDEICADEKLNREFDLAVYESYIDGNLLTRLFFSVYSYIKFLLCKRNYDVYHIHAASRGSTFRKGCYVRAAKRWGKKVIFHIHGAEYMDFYEELSASKRQKVHSILSRADMVIALSAAWKQKFDTTFGLTNCVVLENGINTERLHPAITEPSAYPHAFVCLGRLGKRKGSYDLVQAVKLVKERVPNVKLYLAGDGEIEQVKAQVSAEKLEENIEVVGWADFDKKLDLLSHVSTVVLPSYNEGLPMSILEGMACGKAIISSNVGAIPEVVKEDNGILITPGDIRALADAMVRCATDLDALQRMSQHNMEKIDTAFSMRLMHEKLSGYYKAVM